MASALDRALAARQAHQRLSERDKLELGIPLNMYDAARRYRHASGQDNARIRDILRQERFRNAWYTFRGGGVKGHAGTSFTDKMRAAEVIGWGPPRNRAIERLRNISP